MDDGRMRRGESGYGRKNATHPIITLRFAYIHSISNCLFNRTEGGSFRPKRTRRPSSSEPLCVSVLVSELCFLGKGTVAVTAGISVGEVNELACQIITLTSSSESWGRRGRKPTLVTLYAGGVGTNGLSSGTVLS
jgi:hypothetical protein